MLWPLRTSHNRIHRSNPAEIRRFLSKWTQTTPFMWPWSFRTLRTLLTTPMYLWTESLYSSSSCWASSFFHSKCKFGADLPWNSQAFYIIFLSLYYLKTYTFIFCKNHFIWILGVAIRARPHSPWDDYLILYLAYFLFDVEHMGSALLF